MSHELSDGLSKLAAKTKTLENNVAKASAENKEKLEATLAKVKADSEAQKNQFVAKTNELESKIHSDVSKAKNSFEQKVSQIKAQAEAKREEINQKIANAEHKMDVKKAQNDYDDALNYAENSIEWALIALADVEEATLEAYDAKLNYENSKNS